ncbi:hypothetical protein HPB47_019663 [Ixodes persulcatus]|uniref:Uncharacterized protein n=1 Tax=Ixodes persulcatus TaxID=34615 RepID=A0AC60QHJ2_IXOPE|nr:hypothetical protein HPB47_019663 [Ixodes persulcatus]
MTSQETVDFVKQELDKGTKPLSKICELLFDACLAPDTSGDGTGCDNMTCIVVQFHREDSGDPSGASNTKERKRCLSSEDESRQDESNKKAKADDA